MIRPAHALDAGKTGCILSEFIDKTAWMPRLYSRAQDISFCGLMIDRGWVSVFDAGEIAGFIARQENIIHALYVASSYHRQGVGTALLQHAKSQSLNLRLWTFQANYKAQKFYAKSGFIEKSKSDGRNNDEKLPDLLLEWKK